MKNFVITVDEHDNPLGAMEKLAAHREAVLHRAFSVLLFNTHGQMLLHQRAHHKYHCGGLWTNACCSHPAPGETIEKAAKRRLTEELGLKLPPETDLYKLFEIKYNFELSNGLFEHEYDHVIAAITDLPLQPNPNEVNHYKYLSINELVFWLQNDPDLFTPWFKLIMKKYFEDRIKITEIAKTAVMWGATL